MLTDTDLEGLAGIESAAGLLTIVVHESSAEAELSAALARTAEAVAAAARGGVVLQRGDGSGLAATPALTLQQADGRAVDYLALPAGQEKAPFVEAVIALATGEPSSELSPLLAGIERPATLEVFMATACPHCPHAVRAAVQAALATPRVRTVVIDAQQYPALAERYKVASVPATILDGGLSLTGVVPTKELAEQILSRGTDAHEASVFRSLVGIGRLTEAAERLGSPVSREAFVQAWRESSTSSRIGLMLVVESALEVDRTCLDEVVPALCRVTGTDDETLRGDTADLLGQIGALSAKETLERLARDPNSDVAQIARESLGALIGRA